MPFPSITGCTPSRTNICRPPTILIYVEKKQITQQLGTTVVLFDKNIPSVSYRMPSKLVIYGKNKDKITNFIFDIKLF